MSTIDSGSMTSLARQITALAADVRGRSQILSALLPADQWQSPSATNFHLRLEPLATGLRDVADRLDTASTLLLAHLRTAQQREQEIAAATANAVHAAQNAVGYVVKEVLP